MKYYTILMVMMLSGCYTSRAMHRNGEFGMQKAIVQRIEDKDDDMHPFFQGVFKAIDDWNMAMREEMERSIHKPGECWNVEGHVRCQLP